MFLINRFLRLRFISRYREINLFKAKPSLAQEKVFFHLLKRAQNTEWGRAYDYKNISQKDFLEALKTFQEKVPVSTYEQLFEKIDLACSGEENILWPGKVKWIAQSSGTTNDKSKIIPVTREALKECHYQGGEDIIALYLDQNPYSKLFSGKTLSVGGSFSNKKHPHDLFCGDLSAILINNLPFWARLFRSPKLSTALLNRWEEKVDLIARNTLKKNIVALAGVPSWTLVVLHKVLELSGKKNILEVWPNLEIFIHGGVSFSPYQGQFEEIIPSKEMKYLETYNASEGFFALNDDFSRDDLLLILDSGVFYEFILLEDLEKKNFSTKIISELELGKIYALVISTNGGLWRYLIGDTIKVTSLQPFRIKIVGRTKHFINVFGEELMVSNSDEALKIASQKTGALVSEYTVAPIFMENRQQGGHEWLIEFKKEPHNLDFFISELDRALKDLNSDYEAKRHNDLILKKPLIRIAPKGLFYKWLKTKNKLGGQHKIPRLSNQRDYLEDLFKIMGTLNNN